MTENQKILNVLNEITNYVLSIKTKTNIDKKKINTIVKAINKVVSKIKKQHE